MAHFVRMNGNVCGEVVVVNNEVLNNAPGMEAEAVGISFLKSIYGEDTQWLQTSINWNFRGRYAGPGIIYDPDKDEFVTSIIE